MEFHRYRGVLAFALALALGAVPALAQGGATVTTAPQDVRAYNLPVVAPLGQGWYAAASSAGQEAWMARQAPWGDDLVQVQGTARVAAVDREVIGLPGTPAATMPGDDQLVTGVAQWMVPEERALYEVRFTRLDLDAPFRGAGVMRAVHGDTGRGDSEFPRTLAYLAIYGPVDVFRNGQRIATNLDGHLMVTQGIRAPETHRLLDTANVRPEDIELHVMVQGDIPGRNQDALYVYWPMATLDLRNLSAPVALLPEEMRTAQSLFGTPAVAGFREGALAVPTTRYFSIALRDEVLGTSAAEFPAGPVEVNITNHSRFRQAFLIEGPGIEERTPMLAPGETATLRLTLQPGTYRLASYMVSTPRTRYDFIARETLVVR
ncbi:MAG: hypothetical protein HY321_18310 [Armatimonadetes bacterium]|nr:hypothetical protein [Armatimonadota bacterium]